MTAYSDAVIADSPVAYWRLDEISGTNANDEIGSLDGTMTGGVTLNVTGAVQGAGKAMTFDGTNDYVDLGSPSALRTAQFSIEAWVKFTTNFDRTIFCSKDKGYRLNVSAAHIRGGFYNVGGSAFREVVSRGLYGDDQWHHVVMTYDEVTLILYVDGIVVASLATTDAVDYVGGSGPLGVAIGREGSSSSNYFIGSIDEVAYYSQALSAARVLVHHGLASPRPGWMYTFPPPLARESSGAALVGDQLYSIGGLIFSSGTVQNYMYDPLTRTWTQKASSPYALSYTLVLTFEGNVYVVSSDASRLQKYDPTANTWTDLTAPGYAFTRVAACVNGRYLFYIDAVGATHRVMRYAFDTDTWTDVTPVATLTTFTYFSAVSYGSLIYLVGYFGTSAEKLFAYDPALATYTALASAPAAVGKDPAFIEWNGILWMLGGLDSSAIYTNEVYKYNPVTNTWSAGTSMNGVAIQARAVVSGGLLYALRGSSSGAQAEVQRFQETPLEGTVEIDLELDLFNYAYNQAELAFGFDLSVLATEISYRSILQAGSIRCQV